jgi:hypothetical protein
MNLTLYIEAVNMFTACFNSHYLEYSAQVFHLVLRISGKILSKHN